MRPADWPHAWASWNAASPIRERNAARTADSVLAAAGHDVDTVPGEHLTGRSDHDIVAASTAAERVLISLDVGLGDIPAYPPGSHAGIVISRLADQSAATIIKAIEDLASLTEPKSLAGVTGRGGEGTAVPSCRAGLARRIATGDGLIDSVAAPSPSPVADVRCCWPQGKEAGGFLAGAASIWMMGLGWWPRRRSRSCPPRLRFDRDDAAARGDAWAGCWPIITG
jgi:Domain of unknown function (DUF5615)